MSKNLRNHELRSLRHSIQLYLIEWTMISGLGEAREEEPPRTTIKPLKKDAERSENLDLLIRAAMLCLQRKTKRMFLVAFVGEPSLKWTLKTVSAHQGMARRGLEHIFGMRSGSQWQSFGVITFPWVCRAGNALPIYLCIYFFCWIIVIFIHKMNVLNAEDGGPKLSWSGSRMECLCMMQAIM